MSDWFLGGDSFDPPVEVANQRPLGSVGYNLERARLILENVEQASANKGGMDALDPTNVFSLHDREGPSAQEETYAAIRRHVDYIDGEISRVRAIFASIAGDYLVAANAYCLLPEPENKWSDNVTVLFDALIMSNLSTQICGEIDVYHIASKIGMTKNELERLMEMLNSWVTPVKLSTMIVLLRQLISSAVTPESDFLTRTDGGKLRHSLPDWNRLLQTFGAVYPVLEHVSELTAVYQRSMPFDVVQRFIEKHAQTAAIEKLRPQLLPSERASR